MCLGSWPTHKLQPIMESDGIQEHDSIEKQSRMVFQHIRQAKSELLIYTDILEPRLYCRPELANILTGWVKEHSQAKVKILIAHPHIVIKQICPILGIIQKLPSFFEVRTIDPANEKLHPSEFLIIDKHVILGRFSEKKSFSPLFEKDGRSIKQLRNQFVLNWNQGLPAPDFRLAPIVS